MKLSLLSRHFSIFRLIAEFQQRTLRTVPAGETR
jgi:hypothetical protein